MQLDLRVILRAVVQATSLATLGQAVANRLAASRSVVLARIWFVESDGALDLAGSAGTPSGGGTYTRRDGEFREMAVADSKILEVAATREPFVVPGVRGDEDWLTNSAWAARQGVRSFMALPLMTDEQAVGVLAFFDREMPDEELLSQLRLATDICAVRAEELRARVTSVPLGDLRPHEEGLRSPMGTEVITRAKLRRIEKESIEAALAKTGGRVFGTAGAAVLLGMRPTTLASRMKALGINRL